MASVRNSFMKASGATTEAAVLMGPEMLATTGTSALRRFN